MYINLNTHTALHIGERDIDAGRTLLMKCPHIKSKMINIRCDNKLIQFLTVLSRKLNDKDLLFAINKSTPNHLFTLKSSLFNSEKELNHSLRQLH